MSLQFTLQAFAEIVVPGCDVLFLLQYNEDTVTPVLDCGDDWWPYLDHVNRIPRG